MNRRVEIMTSLKHAFIMLLALAFAGTALLPAMASAGRHHGFMERAVAQLHDRLGLNPQQEALWQKALSSTQQTMAQMRKEHKERRATLLRELDNPKVNLHTLAQQMDALRDQQATARKQVRDQWLAVYDSLDANQQGQVRSFLRERLERAGQWHKHFRGDETGEQPTTGQSGKAQSGTGQPETGQPGQPQQ
jgi:uncharacterized membrane protein